MSESSIDRSQVGKPPYPVKDWPIASPLPAPAQPTIAVRTIEQSAAKDAEHEAKLAQAMALLTPLGPRDLDAVIKMLSHLPAVRLLEKCQALTMGNAEPINKWPGQKQETAMPPKSAIPLRDQLALSSLLDTLRHFGADLPPKDQ